MVVEKNMEVGGGLDSHEDRNYPGFWHNIHSVFHRGLMMLPWYKDLELENFGIHYYRPDPGVVHHFLDKTYLGWFADVKKTVETIERFSKKDAAAFMDIWTRWQPVVRKLCSRKPMPCRCRSRRNGRCWKNFPKDASI